MLYKTHPTDGMSGGSKYHCVTGQRSSHKFDMVRKMFRTFSHSLIIILRRVWVFAFARGVFLISAICRGFVIVSRVVRIAIFLLATASYFADIIRYGLRYCNLVTYSDSFAGDLISFIFQDSSEMLERHREILKHNGQPLYFVADAFQNLPLLDQLLPVSLAGTALYNMAASILVTNCTVEGPLEDCVITKESLVFKFSDALAKNIPTLAMPNKLWALVASTVTVYLLYSIAGMIVSTVITTFLMVNLIMRIFRYGSFAKRLALIINTTIGSIA